jgi:hypothetical protein
VKVEVHSPIPYDTEVDNPLGDEGVLHRMWTWSDGSWLMMRFFDDGAARVTTSRGLTATLEDDGATLHVKVAFVRRALRSTPTAENEAR